MHHHWYDILYMLTEGYMICYNRHLNASSQSITSGFQPQNSPSSWDHQLETQPTKTTFSCLVKPEILRKKMPESKFFPENKGCFLIFLPNTFKMLNSLRKRAELSGRPLRCLDHDVDAQRPWQFFSWAHRVSGAAGPSFLGSLCRF